MLAEFGSAAITIPTHVAKCEVGSSLCEVGSSLCEVASSLCEVASSLARKSEQKCHKLTYLLFDHIQTKCITISVYKCIYIHTV
jgi:hypothetical protein